MDQVTLECEPTRDAISPESPDSPVPAADAGAEATLRRPESLLVAHTRRWGVGLGLRTRGAVFAVCERLLSFDGGVHTARRNADVAAQAARGRAKRRAEAVRALSAVAHHGSHPQSRAEAAVRTDPVADRLA